MIQRGLCSLCLLLAGCVSGPRIDTTYTARSQDSRAQFLIIHYTAGSFPGSLKWLTEGPVSSHYLVNDDPPPSMDWSMKAAALFKRARVSGKATRS